jgi:hypothetical protein
LTASGATLLSFVSNLLKGDPMTRFHTAEKTRFKIEGDKVICPECGSWDIVHAYDTSQYGTLAVHKGQIVAVDHQPGPELLNWRAWCVMCDYKEENIRVDVV